MTDIINSISDVLPFNIFTCSLCVNFTLIAFLAASTSEIKKFSLMFALVHASSPLPDLEVSRTLAVWIGPALAFHSRSLALRTRKLTPERVARPPASVNANT